MNPVLIEFPDRIETERLYMRICMPGDGKTVHESIQASIEDLKQWLPFANKEQSVDDVEINIRKSYSQFLLREDIRIHIFRKEDDVFVGSTGLHRMDWAVRKFEIGYWCDSRYQKNGYITEAVSGLVDFTFNHLEANRIEIRCDTKNISSRKIPEKLGFQLEGILVNDDLSANGKELRDTCVFAKVRKKSE
ncbi:GNAT family N-acetyltransferase [Bacillus sp. DTU_2020_1000418_1_SI_GHA_SEK_038]|uniref:GNAT family N-acetyltransferase n=1 Tax=Bacillus sp. DTU_2020_1000418_1_SI_GHA_SEK_038 TaxID=3077585 RepID=UPI0028F10F78|nr:GNAT family N-acetyltransferase [Bacillus sp. DTU_2020_1000418_1_SI_GHA_SEK_038]WNS77612.1 GNAT family N-acetyltransferase [Bacillus sp. DTU_2020_1000418_1_SI_GHA_SEK_038]